MSKQNYRIFGRDMGKNVVDFEDGRRELLTDEELAELKGGAAVKKLNDTKRIAELEGKVADLTNLLDEASRDVPKLKAELKAKSEALEEYPIQVARLQAEIDELKAALSARDNTIAALKEVPPVSEVTSAPNTVVLGEASESGSTEGGAAEASKVPTSAISLDEAMACRLDVGWDRLKAICLALGVTFADDAKKADVATLITAERERRRKAARK